MSKTIKFVCSSFPSPPPKWVKVRKNYQGSGYNCIAELDSVPLQIQGLVAENRDRTLRDIRKRGIESYRQGYFARGYQA